MAEPLLSFESGFAEAQGRRDTMEDTHAVFEWLEEGNKNLPEGKKCKTLGFFGVYDGHGGMATKKTDETIVSQSIEKGWMNGSTSVCGIILDLTLYIANIGDSEGVLIKEKDGEVVPVNLTTPHKANLPEEKKRIEDLGGHVFFGRVFGALAVSRSFGDAKFKTPKTSQNFVSWEPATQTHTLNPSEDKILLLACDGLWDVMNHQEAATFCLKYQQEGKSAKEIAELLVKEALQKKTEDNVTVVVTFLKWAKDTAEASAKVEPKEEETKEVPAEDANTEDTEEIQVDDKKEPEQEVKTPEVDTGSDEKKDEPAKEE